MKKLSCFRYFSDNFKDNFKPNRLIFQEKAPPEGGKVIPPKPEDSKQKLVQLNEQVGQNNTIAYQRVLALETFRQTVREKLWI
ncbi:hypothetical protein HZC21_03435 [Candidatus Peregrinibacteria bacterium]|nr:hypothetical protein [Candidatus Peregrinibacteria bacterium]